MSEQSLRERIRDLIIASPNGESAYFLADRILQAIRVPERKPVNEFDYKGRPSLYDQEVSWNAAIDEFIKLNGLEKK